MFKVGDVVKIKEGMWKQVNPADYKLSIHDVYIIESYQPGEYPTIKLVQVPGIFDADCFTRLLLATPSKPKRYSIGDEVISTRDTPSIPEGFVGYVVETQAEPWPYVVEDNKGCRECFNEDELELLSAKYPYNEVGISDIARPILGERKIGKIRMELFDTGFPNAILEIAKVMTWANTHKGYKDNDWKVLPDAENAFKGAAARHRVKLDAQRSLGEDLLNCVDEESGITHLAHECFNNLALLELALMGKIK